MSNRDLETKALDEILAPVREDFANSGMTDDDLARLIKSERRAAWEEDRERLKVILINSKK